MPAFAYVYVHFKQPSAPTFAVAEQVAFHAFDVLQYRGFGLQVFQVFESGGKLCGLFDGVPALFLTDCHVLCDTERS